MRKIKILFIWIFVIYSLVVIIFPPDYIKIKKESYKVENSTIEINERLKFSKDYRNSHRRYTKLIKINSVDDIVLELDSLEFNCRLIGLNIPDKGIPELNIKDDPLSQESLNYLEKLKDENLSIEFDSIHSDDSGKLWIYLYKDERLINTEMLTQGLAIIENIERNNIKHLDEFEKAQLQAQNEKNGIWGLK